MSKAIEPIYGHWIRSKKTRDISCCIPNCEKEALAVAAAMEKGTPTLLKGTFSQKYADVRFWFLLIHD